MVRINLFQITALEIISKRNISSVFVSDFRRIQPNCEDRFVSRDAVTGDLKLDVRYLRNLHISFRVQNSGSDKFIFGKNSKFAFVQDKILRARNRKYQARFYSSVEEKNLLLKENQGGKDDWGSPEAKELILHIEGNFHESIKSHDSLLIYFYTVWCRHCKRFKSVYGAAAVKMKKENVPGRLGAIDVTKRIDIADTFNIVSVPALKYFKKGEFIKVYDGKRTTEDIINFMKNPAMEPVTMSKIDI